VRAGAGRRIAEKRRGRRSTTRSRNCPDLAGVLAISGPMGSECWLARQTCAGDDNRCQVARSQIGLASEISRFWGSYVNPSSGRRPSGAGSRGQQAPELDDARPWRRGQPGTSAAGEACARYYVHSTGLQVTTLYSIAYSVKGQQCRRGGGLVHREGIGPMGSGTVRGNIAQHLCQPEGKRPGQSGGRLLFASSWGGPSCCGLQITCIKSGPHKVNLSG
jgi:hypothetical protein